MPRKNPSTLKNSAPGLLLVLEGIDGSGKTTQARSLARRLRARGYAAVYFREPSRGVHGRDIRKKAVTAGSLTPEEELDLFQKDRRDNVARNLGPALAAGKIVVLDRYYYSTIAYQGAKGIDRGRIRRLNERFAIRPDIVFIIDIDPGSSLGRISGRKTRHELFEREDYLAEVRKIFRSFRGRPFVAVDGGRSPKEVGRDIWKCAWTLVLERIGPAPKSSAGRAKRGVLTPPRQI